MVMGLVAQLGMQGLQPSRNRSKALRAGVALPWGGPTQAAGIATGGTPPGSNDFPQGAALTNVGGTAQAEIWTLTVTGSGNVFFQFGAEVVRTATAFAAGTATAAQVCTALQTIWPTWVLPTGSVTGNAGGPYTITFAQTNRIGGNISFVVTGTAAATLVRTQRGSCGAGQYDLTDGSTFTTCDALLVDRLGLSPWGSLPTAPYGATPDTIFSPWAWIEGFFKAADVPNLTTAIVAASPALLRRFYLGAAVTDSGAEIRLVQ
jgi:hypothetical protein